MNKVQSKLTKKKYSDNIIRCCAGIFLLSLSTAFLAGWIVLKFLKDKLVDQHWPNNCSKSAIKTIEHHPRNAVPVHPPFPLNRYKPTEVKSQSFPFSYSTLSKSRRSSKILSLTMNKYLAPRLETFMVLSNIYEKVFFGNMVNSINRYTLSQTFNHRCLTWSYTGWRIRIRSFSGPHFPALRLTTERYSVSLRIQSECGKIRTRKTTNMDTFHVVWNTCLATFLPLSPPQ